MFVAKVTTQLPLPIIFAEFFSFLFLLFVFDVLQGFQFPFAVVLYHSLLKLSIAAVLRLSYKCVTGIPRVHVDWRKSMRKLAPPGIAAGIDIGFSNWGLELVTISLYVQSLSHSASI